MIESHFRTVKNNFDRFAAGFWGGKPAERPEDAERWTRDHLGKLWTLEETRDADVLLHVLDASHPLAAEQAQTVQQVLASMALDDRPIVTVLNKQDRIEDDHVLRVLAGQMPHAIAISALHRKGLDKLLEVIEEHLSA